MESESENFTYKQFLRSFYSTFSTYTLMFTAIGREREKKKTESLECESSKKKHNHKIVECFDIASKHITRRSERRKAVAEERMIKSGAENGFLC